MAAAYSKAKHSGSTDFKPIGLSQDATPGNLIHTAVAGTGDNNADEVYLWVTNLDTVEREVTVEFGGATADEQIVMKIQPRSSLLVVPGLPIQNGLEVRAFGDAADVLNAWGFINKIRPGA